MKDVILVINSGSSSIKFSIFSDISTLELIYHGEIENIEDAPHLSILNAKHVSVLNQSMTSSGHEAALRKLFDWLEHLPNHFTLRGVGHRVVHGGTYFFEPTLINDAVIEKIASLIPLAPLHQPHNLAAIQIIEKLYPNLPQVACFDTTFHRTQDRLATLFAIPRNLTEEGIIRYGFHGISYEYIASVLPNYMGDLANGRVVVAHLGHGASLCAMHKRKSVATSMGFTALDGLMMGSRCGAIDPGVLLYLLQEKNFWVDQLAKLLYQQSGLLGISGISSDMRKLQSSTDPNAIEAVDLFCYRAAEELSALCVPLKGCDAIIFTAGIGENSAIVRKKICDYLKWLGVSLDESANAHHETLINQKESKILVGVIPTNEEYMIAKHASNVLNL